MKITLKRSLALLLALVMCLSVLPVVSVYAEDGDETETTAEAESSSLYEPWGHGYRFVDVLNWDPETDPYSDELVAEVPLQERIATYSPTQSNPDLSDEVQLYAISSSNYRSTDVNEAPWNAGMSYDEFSYNVFKFWQYTDMTGAGGRPTSNIERDASQKEYGTIAIPMAAATNAAHKNGVLSIAEYYTPRSPQYAEEMLQKNEDGSFPYADKLLEIMNYYGFDGYFINQEESLPSEYVSLMKEFMQYMMDNGAYIQWYDSMTNSGSISYQNEFNSVNSDFVYDTTDGLGRVSNSIFLNYWYDDDALKNSAEWAESLGLDPYETVFAGIEGGEWAFGIDLEDFWDIMYSHNYYAGNLMKEDGQSYVSLAIWGSDFYHEQYNKTDNLRYTVEYQWEAEERERMYFTSPTELVGDYDTEGLDRSDVGITNDEDDKSTQLNFKGISRYVVEKSVISGTVFATDFNTGHGMEYMIEGETSREMEWTNLNLQDILPTWQWWIEALSGDEVTLDMEYDYGEKYTRVQGEFPYTQIGAYNGGNSIVIYGDLQESQLVNLYKTELEVTSTSTISLTYYKPSADDSSTLNFAVTFAVDDENTKTVFLPITDGNKQTSGWTTVTVDLSEYAGETIAAIGLEMSATENVEGYQINLGRLEITDGADYTPDAPENVALDLRFDETDELQVSWDLADYSEVVNYHVYAVYADGSYRFVGGAYADEYYISALEDEDNVVALEVRAVGIDGSESEGTQISLETDNRVSNILVVSENNQLVVTWTDPDASFTSVQVSLEYWYTDKEAPASVTVDKGAETAVLSIDLEDGAQYVLSVATVNSDGTVNESVDFFGELADNYSDPYDGEARLQADGLYDMTTPAADDWYTMDVNIDGTTTTYSRFSTPKLQNISVPTSGLSTMVITVTDMDGNVSEAVTKLFFDGVEMDADGGYGAELIPDEVLRKAIQSQVGPTIQDLLDFKGVLDLTDLDVTDLTGLNLLTGMTGLILSGTSITELISSVIPTSVQEIVLDGCEDLVSIELDNRPGTALTLGDLPSLVTLSAVGYGNYDLDLSGCPNLENLYLTGTLMEALDITANVKLANFLIDDSQIASLTNAGAESYTQAYYWVWTNAKLDLTEGTTEGQLYLGMKDYFANAELEAHVADEETTLYSETSYHYAGNNVDLEVEVVVDSGWVHELTSVTFTNAYNNSWYLFRYNVIEATVLVSNDGETWTEVAEYVMDDGWNLETYSNYTTITIDLPEGTYARYVKLVAPDLNTGSNYSYITATGLEYTIGNGYPYIRNFTVNGYFIDYTGFFYGGQQPAVVHDEMTTVYVDADGSTLQTLDLLEAYYASATLVSSGVLLQDVADAEWIDADYVTSEAYMPDGVRVTITDSEGNVVTYPDDTLGNTETEKLEVTNIYTHGEYSGEEGDKLFDGKTSTKWCGSDSGAMWLVFELADGPRVLSEWYTLHAGSESLDYIAAAFRLQTLNLDVITEEEYLAMDESGKRAVAANDDYWIDLSAVTGNSANEVTKEVSMDNLVSAQVYRFVVDESGQPGAQTWGALRIYEMELYAFEGTLDFVGNGMVLCDHTDTYSVSYTVDKVEIGSTTVKVGHKCVNFTDISGHWAEEDICYVTEKGLFAGTSDTTFEPNSSLTRAMVVAVLYRQAGEPEVDGTLSFTDVSEDSYYYDALVWAVEEGIAAGTSSTTFEPSKAVTRQDMVCFLYRFATSQGMDVSATADISSFSDAGTVSSYAQTAMSWAVATSVIQGTAEGTLSPKTTATRAQYAAVLARLLQA